MILQLIEEQKLPKIVNSRIMIISPHPETLDFFSDILYSYEIKDYLITPNYHDAGNILLNHFKINQPIHILFIDYQYLKEKEFNKFFKDIIDTKYYTHTLKYLLGHKNKQTLDINTLKATHQESKNNLLHLEIPDTKENIIRHLVRNYNHLYPTGVQSLEINHITEKCLHIIFPKYIDSPIFTEINLLTKKIIQNEITTIFDYSYLQEINSNSFRNIFQQVFKLKKKGIKYKSINIPDFMYRYIDKEHLRESFQACRNMGTAISDLAIPTSKNPHKHITIDVRVVNPFIMATIKCFKEDLKIDIRPAHPFLMPTFNFPQTEFATIIDIHSDLFNGAMAQIFQKETFITFFTKLTKDKQLKSVDEVFDLTDRILLTIFDNAHKELKEKNDIILEKVSPKVVHGFSKVVQAIPNNSIIVIPLESSIGRFDLLIAPY